MKFIFKPRVYVAIIFLAITLFSILYGGIALAIFLGTLMALGSTELIKMINSRGYHPSQKMVYIFTFLFVLFAYLKLEKYFPFIITAGIIAAFLDPMRKGKDISIADISTTLMCIMYGGWLPVHIYMLRNLNLNGLSIFGLDFADGLGYLVLMFFVITVSDVAGYYVGTNFGKTQLAPIISPKKTVEGSAGSTIGGIVIAMFVGHFINLSLFHSFMAGLLLVMAAQLGDLAESTIKRDAGVKDSGTLLPEHGGILDRADSYIFTGAVAYYYFKLFIVDKLLIYYLPS